MKKRHNLQVKVGDVVTYAAFGLDPRSQHYKIIRVRYDLLWNDVVTNYMQTVELN